MRPLERGHLHVKLCDLTLLHPRNHLSIRLSLGHFSQLSVPKSTFINTPTSISLSRARSADTFTSINTSSTTSTSATTTTSGSDTRFKQRSKSAGTTGNRLSSMLRHETKLLLSSPFSQTNDPKNLLQSNIDKPASSSANETIIQQNSHLFDSNIDIPLTFHAYLFDTLKVEVLSSKSATLSIGTSRIGRAKLRLCNLSAEPYLSIQQSLQLSDDKAHEVGSINITIVFSWITQLLFSDEVETISQSSPLPFTPLVSIVSKEQTNKQSPSPISSNTHSPLSDTSHRSYTLPHRTRGLFINTNPMSTNSTPHSKSSRPLSNSAYTSSTPSSPLSTGNKSISFAMPLVMSPVTYESPISETITDSVVDNNTIAQLALDDDDEDEYDDEEDDPVLYTDSKPNDTISTLDVDTNPISPTNISPKTNSNSLPDNSDRYTPETPSAKFVRYTKMNALREVINLYRSFFGEGWRGHGHSKNKLSTSQIVSALTLIKKWYTYRNIATSFIPIHMLFPCRTVLEDIHRLFRYCLATYGWMGLNFFGYGGGYLLDAIRRGSDRRCVLQFLKLQGNDLLVWEMDHSGVWTKSNRVKRDLDKSKQQQQEEDDNNTMSPLIGDQSLKETGSVCRPYYFVLNNPQNAEICICIRGTLNASDTLMDIMCHYEPFLGGLVHSGVLAGSRRLYQVIRPALYTLIAQHRPKTLVVTGHSMGGGTAQILAIMLRHYDLLKLRNVSGYPTMGDTSAMFNIRCIAFAPPPVLSADLALRFADFETVVNHTDIVPRLSYGAAMNMKEMLVHANETLEMTPTSSFLSSRGKSRIHLGSIFFSTPPPHVLTTAFAALDKKHDEILRHSPNLLLVLPGTIYYFAPSETRTTHYTPNPVTGKLQLLSRHRTKPRRHLECWAIDPLSRANSTDNQHLPNTPSSSSSSGVSTEQTPLPALPVGQALLQRIPVAPGAFMKHTPDAYDRAIAQALYWATEMERENKGYTVSSTTTTP